MNYDQFLDSKNTYFDGQKCPNAGSIAPHLFDFQKAIVKWALSRGRAAIFADTGLGKTVMMVEWARHVSIAGRVLMLAPLAVAEQTVKEADRFGVEIQYMRQDDLKTQIVITNYDMMHHFDPDQFVAIVLDESSILKSYTGAFRNEIIRRFAATPWKLACTATPAPNDFTELGNHSEFLGVKSRTEMLAEFFVHDGGETQKWRLKKHAIDIFWRWVCSWGALFKKPSDLGFSDDRYILPPLVYKDHLIRVSNSEAHQAGLLFAESATTLNDQRAVRRSTIDQRVAKISEIIDHDRPVLVWCELNRESEMLANAIDDAREVKGADSPDKKKANLLGFSAGEFRVMVSKPKIAGFGMNWQHCCDVVFVGPSHSFEQTYQAIRRCWRFGQANEVVVHTIVAETEQGIVENARRKTKDAELMSTRMVKAMQAILQDNVRSAKRETNQYQPTTTMEIPSWIQSINQ